MLVHPLLVPWGYPFFWLVVLFGFDGRPDQPKEEENLKVRKPVSAWCWKIGIHGYNEVVR